MDTSQICSPSLATNARVPILRAFAKGGNGCSPTCQPLSLSVLSAPPQIIENKTTIHLKVFSSKNTPKNTCQAPKPCKSFQINEIDMADELREQRIIEDRSRKRKPRKTPGLSSFQALFRGNSIRMNTLQDRTRPASIESRLYTGGPDISYIV